MSYGSVIEEEWMNCPQCHSPMVELWNYEVDALGNYEGFDAEKATNMRGQFDPARAVAQLITNDVNFKKRKKLLADIKRTKLPGYPKSLICPRCMHVIQRTGDNQIAGGQLPPGGPGMMPQTARPSSVVSPEAQAAYLAKQAAAPIIDPFAVDTKPIVMDYNTSGTVGDVPIEIARLKWSWGASLLTSFWARSHNLTAITSIHSGLLIAAILCLFFYPVVSVICFMLLTALAVALGVIGPKQAWRYRRFDGGVDEYFKVQNAWTSYSFIANPLALVLIFGLCYFIHYSAVQNGFAKPYAWENRTQPVSTYEFNNNHVAAPVHSAPVPTHVYENTSHQNVQPDRVETPVPVRVDNNTTSRDYSQTYTDANRAQSQSGGSFATTPATTAVSPGNGNEQNPPAANKETGAGNDGASTPAASGSEQTPPPADQGASTEPQANNAPNAQPSGETSGSTQPAYQ